MMSLDRAGVFEFLGSYGKCWRQAAGVASECRVASTVCPRCRSDGNDALSNRL
jgi:hypothetical protein